MDEGDGVMAATQPAVSVVPASAAPALAPVSAPVGSVTNVYIQLTPPAATTPLRAKSAGTAYLLMGFSLVGICGMQHFYLGKIGQGVLWLITFGLFGFGTVTDLFTLRSQTKTINARRALGIG